MMLGVDARLRAPGVSSAPTVGGGSRELEGASPRPLILGRLLAVSLTSGLS